MKFSIEEHELPSVNGESTTLYRIVENGVIFLTTLGNITPPQLEKIKKIVKQLNDDYNLENSIHVRLTAPVTRSIEQIDVGNKTPDVVSSIVKQWKQKYETQTPPRNYEQLVKERDNQG